MEKIKELQEFLQMENVKDAKERFKEIAKMLFQDFHIEKGGVCYDFLEIEFYFFSDNHPDTTTYPRNTEAGEWFFHLSGLDIAFKSKKKHEKGKDVNVFGGGILIRSILKREEGKEAEVIAGPLRCLCDLCKGIMNIIGQPISLQLVANENQEKDVDIKDIKWTIRQGIAVDKNGEIKEEACYCAYVRNRYNCDSEWKNGGKTYSAKPWERVSKECKK